MASPRVRPLRLLAAPALALALVAVPAPAQAATNTDRAQAAAAWLATQLEDGAFLPLFPGFADTGLTIDAVLAFAAAGVGRNTADDMLAWLTAPEHLDTYTGAAFGGYAAGETAKAILAIEVGGGDPTAVNGVDLVTELRGLQQPTGLFQNPDPAVFDDTNLFDQTLVMLALARTAGGVPPAAIDFLVDAQCADHSFPGAFGNPASCGSVDGTAMAAQALLAAGHPELAGSAVDWLAGHQDPAFGGYDDGAGQPRNTNSTGLAAQALRAYGRDTEADKAVAFIAAQQVGCDGPAANQGGIAYQPTDPNDPDNTGFQPTNAARATAQAILGLAGVPMGKLDLTASATGLTRLDCTTPSPSPSPSVSGAASPAAQPILAVTGVRAGPIALTGAALVLLGAIVLIGLRRRRPGRS